ncbi:uncharacterized protein KY384_004469 [Bacidia gigantensis]|uniref:uncharacterized protein n=1 Tax=Bacidia gigantensis TaxID=2732470 RepID=UPI001D05BCD8|nr:uncharacterized protein KY384_004469 [Bacidia gigantensis]KAG8531112.1 hypothetical protein KY384_004469 [Bacidia gigantensis]
MASSHYTSPPSFDDRTSLTGSLNDFSDSDKQQSPVFGLPSQHSGFRAGERSASEHEEDPEEDVASDESPWSPPAWRQPASAGGWYRHQPYSQDVERLKSKSASRSRTGSRGFSNEPDDDEDITLAAKTPLPRGSTSPVRESLAREAVRNSRVNTPLSTLPAQREDIAEENVEPVSNEGHPNIIRFSLRADVQQRTEPIDAAITWLRNYYTSALRSWASLISNVLIITLAISTLRFLFRTPILPATPDLVKVAGLARSFEPLVFYSETGVRQIGDLQETGVAVWDLGESVRSTNMTSGPIIVDELDELSESLKGLSIELTKFFANVDGDIDGILIVMDWAKRELVALDSLPSNSLSYAFANIHSLLSNAGIFESRSTGLQTPLGKIFTTIFGTTSSQRTHQTLHHTFNEFLEVLEQSINSELIYSTALFALFENIDRQFLNLQRTVIREFDTQERLESEFLSSLWTRIIGANTRALRKYEKNKNLLASVRAKTTQNKSLLVEHNGKLQALKGNLEALRRKLMSPLVSRVEGGGRMLGVEEQIKGLDGTYEHLRRVREKQKERVLEVWYGGSRRGASVVGREEIDG